MKKNIYLIPLLLLFPLGADAAFNTFNTAGGGQITLPSNGKTYTLEPSTRLESFTVGASSMSFDMSGGSVLQLKSADKSNFVVTGASPCEVITTCESSQSTLLIQCSNISSQTVTVTIDGTCTGSSGSSGAGGSSGGAAAGGGGAKTTSPPPTPPPPPPAPVSKPIALAPPPVPAPAPAIAPVAQKIVAQLNTTSKGAEVKKLEEKLMALGYLPKTAKADGVYDKDVVDAVKKFQKANKLSQVGVVGPATLAALNKITQAPAAPAPAPTPSPAQAAPAGETTFKSLLRVGSSGDEVRALQEKLQDLGFFPADLDATGYFGPATANAVKKFQAANGVAQVGYVGVNTREALNAGGPVPPAPAPAPTPSPAQAAPAGETTFKSLLRVGSSGDEVRALQEKLQDLGFFPADLDATGYFGPATANAVKKFQAANGVAQVGYVGVNTRAALNSQ